jgi:hypothetical protein
MMRVMHMSAGEHGYGGIETMLLTLARLSNRQLESVFGIHFDRTLAQRLRAAGAIVHSVGERARLRNPPGILRERQRFGVLLRRERIDTVVAQNSRLAVGDIGPGCAAKRNFPGQMASRSCEPLDAGAGVSALSRSEKFRRSSAG